MHRAGLALVLGLLLTAALAGCAGKDSPPASPSGGPTGSVDGSGTASPQGPVDAGAAPAWKVGQHWTHDWTLGDLSFQVESIVVAAEGGGYRLATATTEDAANHAAFFFHDLGTMDKDWTVHQQEYAYPWYAFPLTDGKTWTAGETNIDTNLEAVSRELTMTARLVPAEGGVPEHYAIEQRTAEGALRATYDYRADLGWFSTYKLFDPAGDGTTPQITMATDAVKQGYTGEVHEATADFLLSSFSLLSPIGGQAEVNPVGQFTVGGSHTHVLFILFAFAAAGAAHAELLAPDGQHWEATAVGDADGNNVAGDSGLQQVVPAVAGDWRMLWAGVSPIVAGGGGYAWGVTVTSGTL